MVGGLRLYRALILMVMLLLTPAQAQPPSPAGGTGSFFNFSIGHSAATTTATDTNIQLPVCPAGNCPVPPKNPVLTGSFLGGQTTKDSTQAEWLGVDSLYVNTGQINGQKVGRYIGVTQGPLAGTVWSLNTLTQRAVGNPTGSVGCGSNCVANGSGTIGYELDFTNWDKSGTSGGTSIETASAATYAAGKITFTIPGNPAAVVGGTVNTNGFTPGGYNGTFVIGPGSTATSLIVAAGSDPGGPATATGTVTIFTTLTVTAASYAGGTLTFTTSGGSPSIRAGGTFTTAGFAPAGYNGAWTALADAYGNTVKATASDPGAPTATTNGVFSSGNAPFTVGMFINTLSSYPSTAGIFLARANGQTVASWGNGMFFGPGTVQDNTIFDATDASFSYQVGAGHTHNVAIYDNSNSQYGVQVNGSHTQADFWASDNAPVAFQVNGNHTVGLQLATAGSLTHAIELAPTQDICFNITNECLAWNSTTGLTFGNPSGLQFRVNSIFNSFPNPAGVNASNVNLSGVGSTIKGQDGGNTGTGASNGADVAFGGGAGFNGGANGSVLFLTAQKHPYEKPSGSSILTGGTVTFTDGKEIELIAPAGTLAALTVQLPSCGVARDGQVRRFTTTQAVTALTVIGSAGATVVGAPTALTATQPGNRAAFICSSAVTTWYPY